MTTIAAVLVSLPERHRLLAEALESVHEQTRPVDDIVVGIDPYRLGEVGNMNRLLDATSCDWLAFLHDDDLWLPRHIETAEQHMDDHDVIVSRVTCVGRPQETLEPQHDDFADLMVTNWFPPSAVIARAEVFGRWCEGAPPEQPAASTSAWVDWTNWRRLYQAGARMVHTNEATMLYRFGAWGNGSWR